MQKKIDDLHLTQSIVVDSAGTSGYHDGRPADSRMRSVAGQRGYLLTGIARSLTKDDLRQFDLIIAMDRENLRAIHQLGDTLPNRVRLFSDFLGEEWPRDVPDPYYGGQEGFEYVLDMLEVGCNSIIEYLKSQQKVTQ